MTCQSLAANAAGCLIAKEVHRNAMANERFTGRSISAPWYRKSLQSQMTWLSDSRPPRSPLTQGRRGLRRRVEAEPATYLNKTITPPPSHLQRARRSILPRPLDVLNHSN